MFNYTNKNVPVAVSITMPFFGYEAVWVRNISIMVSLKECQSGALQHLFHISRNIPLVPLLQI